MIQTAVYPWDVAAGSVIAREAGADIDLRSDEYPVFAMGAGPSLLPQLQQVF